MADGPFLIRSVEEADLSGLHRLSQMGFFINLPDDKAILQKKIRKSVDSFSGTIEEKFDREYILVMEDVGEGTLVGSSSIIARHGTAKFPHMYFQLKEVKKYSETIHSGIIHKVLQLKFNYDGPSEIGGLVVDRKYRSHRKKLGRQLSFARFLFVKMKRRWFKDRFLSELMPPLVDGESLLWEALGRRFTNLSYEEADVLSRKNKEFVTSLFPKGDIFTCLLPGEVRDVIGKVGKETQPVKHMLEKIGFRWKEHIDPFDGGPHYWADTDRITIVQASCRYSIDKNALKGSGQEKGLVGRFEGGRFRAVQTPYDTRRGRVALPKAVVESLDVEPKESVFVMPL